ncbi:MAG: hypothetical protein NUW21_04110 [Elusimicrobia bacterium]|nr:hypothetical protein [Elusimicrobiota bacterium]
MKESPRLLPCRCALTKKPIAAGDKSVAVAVAVAVVVAGRTRA